MRFKNLTSKHRLHRMDEYEFSGYFFDEPQDVIDSVFRDSKLYIVFNGYSSKDEEIYLLVKIDNLNGDRRKPVYANITIERMSNGKYRVKPETLKAFILKGYKLEFLYELKDSYDLIRRIEKCLDVYNCVDLDLILNDEV